MGKGLENYYVIKNNKKLHFGYTTGSCAAAASKAAVKMLLGGRIVQEIELMTPKGILLRLPLEEICCSETEVSCAVRKDGGDDPDATDGILIFASVRKTEREIQIDGGIGVGRVTRPGLNQAVGEAAINPVPRAMIQKEVEEIAEQYDYEGGLEIVISVPEGIERSKKTFNPRLGIEGGISILGTTGIVEPMSEKALVESIRVEMQQHYLQGEEYLIVTPGNYGAQYLRSHMELPFENNIKCSNYVGETIDMAINMGVKGLLFVSHIGKFIKVAGGIMNTHSHCADSRMELLAANAIRAGADLESARQILNCNTTDEALEVLEQKELLKDTMQQVMDKIQYYLDHRSYEQILLGAVVFSNVQGYLGQTASAEVLIRILSKEEKNGQMHKEKGEGK